jgi:hypothetical protein
LGNQERRGSKCLLAGHFKRPDRGVRATVRAAELEIRVEALSPVGGPITIDGLWGLRFAPATPGAGPNTLFFTAGINHEADGLFGEITPNG